MPGASSVSSGGGGNGGGTKRRASEVPHHHGQSPGAGGMSSYSTGNSAPSSNAVSGFGGEEGRTGGCVNGVGGEDGSGGGGRTGGSSSMGADEKTGSQQMSQAVMKMKAEVFEKDRDNFLNIFEKPTQIYRFLRARMVESPIFLQRNLSYMKSRMSRSHNTREGFRVEDLLQHKRECQRKERKLTQRHSQVSPRTSNSFFHSSGPIKFYNVIVMGVSDGQIWHPDTKAKVDIVIARVCMNKRKEGPGPVSKIFDKSVDFKVFSPSVPGPSNEITIPYPQNCPVVAIPAELCSVGSNGHTVRSFKLVIRVTIPNKCLIQNHNNNRSGDHHQANHLNSRNSYNNNSSDNSDEPKAKRRRSAPTTKDRENFIYDGESNKTGNVGAGGGSDDLMEDLLIYTGNISLYEHDIPGDKIEEVDLDLQLKKAQRGSGSKISHQRIRREISWEPFDEKHAKVLEQSKPPGRCAKVCVAIRTSSSPPPSFVDPPAPLLCAAIKKEDGAANENSKMSLARQEMQQSVRVIYHFTYGNSSQQQTESRDDLRCPWCSLNCMQLYSLMKHLKLCHPRYQFTYSPIHNGAKIDVAINDSYDGSYTGSAFDLVCQPPGEAFARNGPTKRTEVFSILVCRPKACKQTLQEFFDCDEKDVDQRRTYITGHNRLYHHTSTCLPIHPREIDVDSEGEPDPEWLRVKTTMMIDEFTDVNEGEKELMKLWNLHVMKYNYVGDCQIEFACKRFVELHGKELIHKNLYRNFCLHLTNLFDFGLLTPQGVHNTIQQLHSQMRESSATAVHLLMNREGWKMKSSHLSHSVNGLLANSEVPSITSSVTSSRGGTAATNGTTSTAICVPTPPTSNVASPKGVLTSASKPAHSPATPTSGVSTITANRNSSSGVAGSGNSSSSPHVNGVNSLRKLEVKDERSPNKKQTFFWLGGSYN